MLRGVTRTLVQDNTDYSIIIIIIINITKMNAQRCNNLSENNSCAR